jgi:phage terminase small subunit
VDCHQAVPSEQAARRAGGQQPTCPQRIFWILGAGGLVFPRCQGHRDRPAASFAQTFPRLNHDFLKEIILKSKAAVQKSPKHLRAATSHWWAEVVGEYELDSHHIRLLTKACEAFDRSEQAREARLKHGLTFNDRFGSPHARPECAIERDSRLAFARLVREIGLEVSPPSESRPNGLRANRG